MSAMSGSEHVILALAIPIFTMGFILGYRWGRQHKKSYDSNKDFNEYYQKLRDAKR